MSPEGTERPGGLADEIARMCSAARVAARLMAGLQAPVKDHGLRTAAAQLRAEGARLLEANAADVEAARAGGATRAFLDRLALTPDRIELMARGLEEISALPDPVGETIATWRRPNGLEISQVRIPLGVIAVIYESRPNVTADAAGLCVKTGNAVVLRGGSEALGTNRAIADVVARALTGAGLPPAAVQLVPTADRAAVLLLLEQEESIDVVVPRGGVELLRLVRAKSRIPVIQHFEGICHVYVDSAADLDKAERICLNAKIQRPGVCNAMENLLVHTAIAESFLPRLAARLATAGVEIRGCERSCRLVPQALPARPEDWDTEYLDLILAVKVVDSLAEAISFIATHGTGLADAIVTEHYGNARQFTSAIDSAAVFVNASTRFTDGSEFGFGAEIGVSTNRLHARGPVGPRELTTYKYIVRGDGQVRE